MNYGQIYSGALSTTDCTALNGAYDDIYTFNGFASQQIVVEMTSSDFDTLLYLFDPNGNLLAVGDDANFFDSRIPRGGDYLTLPMTGTYYVVASSFSAHVTGNYQVRVSQNAGPCTFTPLAFGDTISDQINPNCSPFDDGHLANLYTFYGIAGQPVSMRMSSTEVDSFLFLVAPNTAIIASDNNGGGGFDARIPAGSGFALLPQTGLYTIIATSNFSFDTGGFLISLNVDIGSTTVTNTNDSGAGSLRQAIQNANANPGADTIRFAIPGTGVKTITPLFTLPPITGPVTIDGTTQPGYAGTPLIELNGLQAGPQTVGLKILGGNSRVRGLVNVSST